MYDIPSAAESVVEIRADVDLDARPWSIGLITGPSGCGKTSIARHLFGDALIEGYDWGDGAVVTEFDEALPIDNVIRALSSVGFSSPPAWLRPFRVLSNGERFRCNLARALVDPRPLVAIDEYTSVVHRKVAQIGSAAVAKHVRRSNRRFVAVSCHDDLVEWLQPDWILEPRPAPHVGLVTWRSVQPRPRIELEIVRCEHAAWPWFAPHHYLTHELNKSAKCFMGLIDGAPSAFCGVMPFPHRYVKNTWRTSRTVVLPDFQGIGIGTALSDKIGAIAATNGLGLRTTPTHPAQVASRMHSPNWEMVRERKVRRAIHWRHQTTQTRLAQMTASFRYIGGPVPPAEVAQARLLWHAS